MYLCVLKQFHVWLYMNTDKIKKYICFIHVHVPLTVQQRANAKIQTSCFRKYRFYKVLAACMYCFHVSKQKQHVLLSHWPHQLFFMFGQNNEASGTACACVYVHIHVLVYLYMCTCICGVWIKFLTMYPNLENEVNCKHNTKGIINTLDTLSQPAKTGSIKK